MWPHVLGCAIGIWLTAAPQVLGYTGAARTNDHILGPLAASFACIAIWDVTRSLRWLNVGLGAWLILAPWVLGYPWPTTLHSTLVGCLIAGLGLVRGKLRHRMGGGWSSLFSGRLFVAPAGNPAP